MAYSEDSDLTEIRPDVLSLGVSDWDFKHNEAKLLIDRAIDKRWYRSIALDNNIDYRDVPYNGDNLSDEGEQLRRLSCYKTFELIYLYLQKNTEKDDGFERQRKVFKDLYNEEFDDVINCGIDYDWDRSGVIALEEQAQTKKRRLKRA